MPTPSQIQELEEFFSSVTEFQYEIKIGGWGIYFTREYVDKGIDILKNYPQNPFIDRTYSELSAIKTFLESNKIGTAKPSPFETN